MLVMVLDATGRIQAAGPDTAGFVAPEGGSIVPAPKSIHADIAALDGPGADLTWQGGKIVPRVRAKTAVELDNDYRADVAAKLDAALTTWSTLTPAQKDSLLLTIARGVQKAMR